MPAMYDSNNFLNELRSAFNLAHTQGTSRGEDQLIAKRNEQKIIDTLSFATDDDTPEKVMYIPFSWKRNGHIGYGYLMRGAKDNKIYGLESGEMSMTPSATKKFMESMAKDNRSSFSDPQNSANYAFLDTAKKQQSDAMNYMLQKDSPFSGAVDNLISEGYNGIVSDFIKNLRKSVNSGLNYEQIYKNLQNGTNNETPQSTPKPMAINQNKRRFF